LTSWGTIRFPCRSLLYVVSQLIMVSNMSDFYTAIQC